MEKLFKIYYLREDNTTLYREVKAFSSHLEADAYAKSEVEKNDLIFNYIIQML
jgi:hypothetical protein